MSLVCCIRFDLTLNKQHCARFSLRKKENNLDILRGIKYPGLLICSKSLILAREKGVELPYPLPESLEFFLSFNEFQLYPNMPQNLIFGCEKRGGMR